MHAEGKREGLLRYRLIPQVLAFVCYHLSWLLYVIRPHWSYRLHAQFAPTSFRRIGLDEREHKLESLARMMQPRFA
ncbi:MAG: hypothetical protein GY711_09840 [bacterium]|nr:hypothetical protein [bacterium]